MTSAERGGAQSRLPGDALDKGLAAQDPVTAPGQPDQALLGQPLLGPLMEDLGLETPVQAAAAI